MLSENIVKTTKIHRS